MRQLKITASFTDRDNLTLDKYLSDVSREGMITQEDEVELTKLIKEGDQVALDKMVRANLRFVVSVAKQYQGQGMPLIDMISEGNMGLIKAAERFDETRGFKFISYAVWWIRQSIMSAIAEHARTVRLPLNQMNNIRKIRRASVSLEQEHQRPPTSEELSAFLEYPEESIKSSILSSKRGVSIDAPMGDEEDFTLSDMLTGDGLSSTESAMHYGSLKLELERAMDTLNETERQILSKYFGVGCEEISLTGIAEELNLSKERVRQIKQRALKSLSHRLNKEMLTYLN
ncbi:MAG: RNA polymerase sigma factor RpoD/SigA [Salibacteraceae bacterium]